MSWPDILLLVISILVCEGAGGIGAIFTMPAIPAWYAGLKKPVFTPPNKAFGPVWLTLYLLMGIAVWLVWREGLDTPGVLPAFILFWTQLALNILWSVAFFGLKSLAGGVIVILALLIMIFLTILEFLTVSPAAGILLVPYILWVAVATNLNIRLWRLNR